MDAPHLRPPAPFDAAEIEAARARSPGEKLTRTFELVEQHRERTRAAMRAQYPDASDDEIFLRSGAAYLDRVWMIRVYGWDPDLPADSDAPYSLRSALTERRWLQRRS